jgi:hypothetical protein
VSVLTRGSHQSAGVRKEAGVPVRCSPTGPRAAFFVGPKRCPSALFYFYFVFPSSFLFLFSYFFHNFCKDTSIRIKLLPEIFKRGAQYSKSVIKQVFK